MLRQAVREDLGSSTTKARMMLTKPKKRPMVSKSKRYICRSYVVLKMGLVPFVHVSLKHEQLFTLNRIPSSLTFWNDQITFRTLI